MAQGLLGEGDQGKIKAPSFHLRTLSSHSFIWNKHGISEMMTYAGANQTNWLTPELRGKNAHMGNQEKTHPWAQPPLYMLCLYSVWLSSGVNVSWGGGSWYMVPALSTLTGKSLDSCSADSLPADLWSPGLVKAVDQQETGNSSLHTFPYIFFGGSQLAVFRNYSWFAHRDHSWYPSGHCIGYWRWNLS